jgi:tetratricopeptide (TPR) repeat protein
LVLPFTAQADPAAPGGAGGNLWLGEAAAVLITDGLTARGVTALTRDERVAAFDRLRLPMRAALTRATMIRVGELLGASEVVFGDVQLADRLSVRVRVIQLGPGRQLEEKTDAADLTGIFALFDRVSEHLAEATGRVMATPAPGPALSLEAFEAYVKGLVAATPAAGQRFLEAAMSLAPGEPRVLLALWRSYADQDDHDKALAVANAVTAESTLWRKARFAVAQSLIALRRFDGAHKELTALSRQRFAPAIENAVGVVQLRRGVLTGADAAAAHFARAADARPDDTDFLFNTGYAYALARDAANALHWLRETVRFDAADGDAHLVMSSVLASAGRAVEAQREIELARLLGTSLETATLTLSPVVAPNLERLRTELEFDGGARVADAIGNPAQRDQQDAARFHLERGRKLFDEQKDREATDELRRAAYLAPYAHEPHLLLGRLYQRSGRLAEAIDAFTVANWAGETAAGRLALAQALFESGDSARARREAERALALDPGSAAAKELLKKIGGGLVARGMVLSTRTA